MFSIFFILNRNMDKSKMDVLSYLQFYKTAPTAYRKLKDAEVKKLKQNPFFNSQFSAVVSDNMLDGKFSMWCK